MNSLKTIRTRHLTSLISSHSSKLTNLSSIPQRPFSAHTADEKGRLSGFFRRVLSGEERTDETNRTLAENAESEETIVACRLRNLEEEIRDLSSKRSQTSSDPIVATKTEKRALSVLFRGGEKGQSKSAPELKKSEKIPKAKLVAESKSAPVERTAYGVEDPMVHRELSPDMKMFAEHLYAKGYLKNANFMPRDRFDPTYFEVSYAREFLKFAAVKFGEDHLDVARWLSAGDLKKVALFGCPSLGQRTVFAAKHMRRFFKIDEPSVCQACTLKKLCKHPNKSKQHSSSTKLSLDKVIKVLIMYAMESVPQKLVVPEDVRNSVSRLLKEITSLSQEKS